MIFWFILIDVGIVVVFRYVGKICESFAEHDLKVQEDIRNRWYDERDKAVEKIEREIEERRREDGNQRS